MQTFLTLRAGAGGRGGGGSRRVVRLGTGWLGSHYGYGYSSYYPGVTVGINPHYSVYSRSTHLRTFIRTRCGAFYAYPAYRVYSYPAYRPVYGYGAYYGHSYCW